MGQRHQIFTVVKKDDKYIAVQAYHHQWLYGDAVSNRIQNAIRHAYNLEFGGHLGLDNFIKEIFYPSFFEYHTDRRNTYCHNDDLKIENKFKYNHGDNDDGITILVFDEEEDNIFKNMRIAIVSNEELSGISSNLDYFPNAWDLPSYLRHENYANKRTKSEINYLKTCYNIDRYTVSRDELKQVLKDTCWKEEAV